MTAMRLTTRKVDAFTEAEEEMLTLIASEGTAWFLPGLGSTRRDALKDLQRLGHIFPATKNRPREAPQGSTGYRLTNTGREALAEVTRRAGKS